MNTKDPLKIKKCFFIFFIFLFLSSAAFAERYLTDERGNYILNGYGECWQSDGGSEINQPPCSENTGNLVDKNNQKKPSSVKIKGNQIYTEIKNKKMYLKDINDQFEFDKFLLKNKVKNALDNEILLLKNKNITRNIKIIGHTDSIGTNEYNLDLSLKRAKSVAEYMSKHGLENAIVKGVGEQFPIESNDTKQGRARNRRVELHFD